MKRDVKLEAFYRHPPAKVWEALTDPALIKIWLMEMHGFAPEKGNRFQFRSKPTPGWNGIVDCEVLECEIPRRLVYRWQGQQPDGKPGAVTQVAWTLTEENGGTRLRLEHTGFSGVGGLMLSFILGSGWKKKMLGHGADAIEGLLVRRAA